MKNNLISWLIWPLYLVGLIFVEAWYKKLLHIVSVLVGGLAATPVLQVQKFSLESWVYPAILAVVFYIIGTISMIGEIKEFNKSKTINWLRQVVMFCCIGVVLVNAIAAILTFGGEK